MTQKRRGCTQDGGILEKRRQSFPAGSRSGSEEKAALAEPEGGKHLGVWKWSRGRGWGQKLTEEYQLSGDWWLWNKGSA